MNTPPIPSAPGNTPERPDQAVEAEPPPRLPFPVVGVGASAGGLEAFSDFLGALPKRNGMAIVLVQHLAPDRESLLAEILGRRTAIPVREITEGMVPEPDTIYVIRPAATLTLTDGAFHLTEPVEKRGHRHPVDDFFRSLAAEQRERAIVVVMSGTGTNGTAAAHDIRAAGGVCIAQDPATAKFPEMPLSLRNSGLADFVLRAEEIPPVLLHYGAPAERPELPEEKSETEQNELLRDVLLVLRVRLRQDFTGYKNATLLRRIRRRMGLKQMSLIADYVRLLTNDPAEAGALADDLLIQVTGFFRDPEVWTALKEKVIAPLVASRADGSTLRAWVTACSSGEEAYSLAMLLLEAAAAADKQFEIKIFATDIGSGALSLAREGTYPAAIDNEVSPERLARFFERHDSAYSAKKVLRDTVVFASQNILQDPPFSRLDLCTCRNLLIYLQPEIQTRVLALMHFALREDGVLLLGPSETAAAVEDLYEPIDKKHRIFRRLAGTRPALVEFPANPARPRLGEERTPSGQALLRSSVVQLTQQALLARHCPPAVVIDRNQRIVYFQGQTDRFLDQPRGEPTRELLALVKDPLRGILRDTLQDAWAQQRSARSGVFTLELDGDRLQLEVGVAPLDAGTAPTYFLVTFELQRDLPLLATAAAAADPGNRADLERELLRARDELRGNLGEMQANNEEMRASHEELQSANEELQSTNEELETSKEELQSLNEELATVNSQLQAKMEELERTGNDLSSLLSSTNIAVVFLDRQLRIRRFTPAVKDLFELIPADIGRPLADLARKFVDETLLAEAGNVLETLVPERKEISSHSARSYIRSILPYRTQDNRIDGVVLTFVDITELKFAEAALRESEEQHRLMLENIKEYAVFMVNPQGLITTWPRSAERALGYSRTEAIGRHLSLILPSTETGQPSAEQELQEAKEKGSILHEGWRNRRDGSRFWGTGALSAVWDEKGQLRGFVKVLRDNTDRKQAEETLRQAKQKAEAANEAKDQFLATVSHELRTPLSSIVLWANLIDENEPVDRKQLTEVLAAIKRGAEEQRELIEDLVDSARIATGKLRLQPGRTDLIGVARSVIASTAGAAQEKGIKFEHDLDPAIGVVQADPLRLGQVMNNLLSNAVKFTPSGGRVRLKLRRDLNEVEIVVTDTGLGFTEEFRSRLFTRFAQAQGSSARRHGGLGIGLGIAREIVVLHGGTISGDSPGIGRGSTFRVRLPLPALAETDAGVPPAGPAKTAPSLKGCRILLVEDSADTLKAASAVLREAGAEVVAANSAEAALAEFDRRRPDLIVSDLGLPDVDGFEFIRRVRVKETSARAAPLPALALTAFAGDTTAEHARQSGFVKCLNKPIEPSTLIAALAELLQGSRK